MKRLVTAFCVLAILGTSAFPCRASSDEPMKVVADVVFVRPACFLATVIGSSFFVISLPIAATSRSVHKTAEALVIKPARATFTRQLGDMETLEDF